MRLLPFVLLAACVEPAPKSEDALLHYLWEHFDASPTVVTDAITQWHTIARGDEVGDDYSTNGVSALATAKDVSGFYYFGTIDCTVEQMERIFYARDQADIYRETYDAFSREYTSDFDAYVDQRVDRLSWQSTFTDTIMNARYQTELHAILRSVPHGDGRMLIARTHQPAPARFEAPTAIEIAQDFHLDVFYPRADGKLMHLFLMWGQIRLGEIDNVSDFLVGTLLKNMDGWDGVASDMCKNGY